MEAPACGERSRTNRHPSTGPLRQAQDRQDRRAGKWGLASLLFQAADRLIVTSTFRPAWVSIVMRVSTLNKSIFSRMRSLIRG